ncbi:hypothetical protein ABTM48_19580, partial [Acinetobacter baumannii]
RRLEENASSENFLSAAFELADDESLWVRERDRFLAALERSTDASLRTGAARTQQRGDAPASGDPSILREPAPPLGSAGLTQAVLGIAHDGAE